VIEYAERSAAAVGAVLVCAVPAGKSRLVRQSYPEPAAQGRSYCYGPERKSLAGDSHAGGHALDSVQM
jgi:hypothetical protein